MNVIPKQENTALIQIKIKEDGVYHSYDILDPDDEYIFSRSWRNQKSTRPAHQELKDAIHAFRPHFIKLCSLMDAKALIEKPEFEATGAQKGFLKEYIMQRDAMIEVTGVVLSGKDGDRTVKITGIYDGISMNSKPFKFTSDLGFDDDVRELIKAIEDETYNYVFKGYKGDLDSLD